MQLILSLYLALHLTGEVVSVGRIDHALRKWAKPVDPHALKYEVDEFEQ